jgi:glycosyltransferase involved in cell wall biosynthesis
MRPSSGRVRVAHLVSHPIQYFAPLYRELARRPEIDLTVYFYSDATTREFVDAGFGRALTWDTPLLDGYQYRFMPSASRTDISGRFLKRPNLDIVGEVASGAYDVLWVHGYAHLTTWLAVAAARAFGVRVLIRDEQTLLHGRPFARSATKAPALHALYSQSSALYIGEANRRYFAHYGMPPERMYSARYCVDNAFFQSRAGELAWRRDELRARFGIENDAPVVLFAGKLIDKKQPLRLIEAFARVRAQRPCTLLFAGDGPLRGECERLVGAYGLPDVRFAGFLNQGELPDAYAAADVFVLPSRLHETWGLVVNEAMNFELPVVVSDKVGCAEDLVRHGGNGFVVRHDITGELAQAIDTLVADSELRARFSAVGRKIIDRYSIEACADGIVRACADQTTAAVREFARAA